MTSIKLEEQEFVDKAKAFTLRVGEGAVLLLVGSRAAGLNDSWSDLDMWVIGDKNNLSPAEFETYKTNKQVFFDRGDYEAHWTFYDAEDLHQYLYSWPDERMWLSLTSTILFGNEATATHLHRQCRNYPREVVEKKLKWHFGKYGSLLGPLNTAARGMPETSVMVVGQVIEHLCKICCLSELKPFPYAKWLVSVASQTTLGNDLIPYISRATSGLSEFLHPPEGKPFRELIPLKELRETKEIVRGGLKKLGWDSSWIEKMDEALVDTFSAERGY